MKERPTAESKSATEAIVLPQRLIDDVYSLLASLARQRRAAALKELDIPPQPAD